MIDLNEYKNNLIYSYKYNCDNDSENRAERRKRLTKNYKDNFLERIITDTYDFIYDLLNNENIKNGYYLLQLDEDYQIHISLGITGGYPSDTIYITPGNRLVSRYILEKEMGPEFYIDIEREEYTYESEKDVFSVGVDNYLYMRNFPLNIQEIKEDLFGKSLSKGMPNYDE